MYRNPRIHSIIAAPLFAIGLAALAAGCAVTPAEDPADPDGADEDTGTSADALTTACWPYRNVTGYLALAPELTTLTNCNRPACSGSSVTTTATQTVLRDANGSAYVFASNQVITPAEQTPVETSANSWASAHTPSGYFVDYVQYAADPIVGGGSPTWAGIDITVTYRKCTGSQPPPAN